MSITEEIDDFCKDKMAQPSEGNIKLIETVEMLEARVFSDSCIIHLITHLVNSGQEERLTPEHLEGIVGLLNSLIKAPPSVINEVQKILSKHYDQSSAVTASLATSK